MAAKCAHLAESGATRKVVPHLHCDRIGTSVYVCCCETEQAKSGADETVLAAVVIDHSVTMVASVVFDRQTLLEVKKVWTA